MWSTSISRFALAVLPALGLFAQTDNDRIAARCRELIDKNGAGAEDVCRLVAEAQADRWEGHVLLGSALVLARKTAEAEAEFKKAVDLAPTDKKAAIVALEQRALNAPAPPAPPTPAPVQAPPTTHLPSLEETLDWIASTLIEVKYHGSATLGAEKRELTESYALPRKPSGCILTLDSIGDSMAASRISTREKGRVSYTIPLHRLRDVLIVPLPASHEYSKVDKAKVLELQADGDLIQASAVGFLEYSNLDGQYPFNNDFTRRSVYVLSDDSQILSRLQAAFSHAVSLCKQQNSKSPF